MATEGQKIDPASIRYAIAGRVYRIGMRVMTPEGPATIIWFDLDRDYDIKVKIDSTDEEVYTTWRYADPIDAQ